MYRMRANNPLTLHSMIDQSVFLQTRIIFYAPLPDNNCEEVKVIKALKDSGN